MLAAGGVVVGIFTDVTPREVQYVVSHSGATFVLAGDLEQVYTYFTKLRDLRRPTSGFLSGGEQQMLVSSTTRYEP